MASKVVSGPTPELPLLLNRSIMASVLPSFLFTTQQVVSPEHTTGNERPSTRRGRPEIAVVLTCILFSEASAHTFSVFKEFVRAVHHAGILQPHDKIIDAISDI